MASPKKLAHVVFRTGNLAAMCAWYSSVLEARVTFANELIAFVTYDDEHHRVAFANVGATADPAPDARGLGSVAQALLLHSPVPVTVVRAAAAETDATAATDDDDAAG